MIRSLYTYGLLLIVLSACSTGGESEEGLAPDTAAVADTLAQIALPDSASVDSARAVVPGEVLDTVAVPASVEALRLEVARLQGTVAALERTNALLLQAQDDSTSETEDDSLVTTQAREKVQQFGTRMVGALLVLIVSFFVVRSLVWMLETLSERSATRRLFFKKLIPMVRLAVWGFTIYFVLAIVFQLDSDSLLAASAALGVAIGFAAQDILKNIFGGILIIFDQPFQVGDKIGVGGTYGEVVSIGLRSTRIVTPDDNLVSVPNAQVVDGQVANANAGALDCQVVTDLYLPGWVDVLQAKAIAYGAAANSKYVYLDKPIVVIVKDEFKETFLIHLKVKAYVLDTRYEFAFASDVTETAKSEFLKAGLLRPMSDLQAFDEL